jgi:hypothetical protein
MDRAMPHPWKHIDVDQRGDVACVRLRRFRIEEPDIPDMAGELLTLATLPGCKKIALSLGPQPPECLYSIFLAKLMTVQRRLTESGGSLILCEVSPEVRAIFEVCRFADHFQFVPDFDGALV